jgi:hypothetical protein
MLIGTMLLSAAGSVSASPPKWLMNIVTLPSSVSPGSSAGYRVTVTNSGPSNISSLYLVDDQTAIPSYLVTSRQGTCGATNPPGAALFCAFGALNSGDSVTITVAYVTPTSGSSFAIQFQANTTGVTFTDVKNRSHGDLLTESASTALSSNKDFGGAFNVTFGGFVSNSASLTGQNKQSTKVSNVPAATPATVLDGPNVTGTCSNDSSKGIDCSKLFGEWSEVNVGNGGQYSPAIVIQITYKSGTPNAFLHVFQGTQELIGQCAGNVAPTADAQLPCFTWDGNNTASIYTLFNGLIKGL